MALVNEHYLKLKAGYLFPEISRRIQAFTDADPGVEIIRLGIGDVTEPIGGSRFNLTVRIVGEFVPPACEKQDCGIVGACAQQQRREPLASLEIACSKPKP